MLFTIAIPAFKAKFLKQAIDSIIAQTYPNFELIIVNDASPENIDSIVNEYTDKRIHYFKNEQNIGAEHVVDNWNKCLSYAKGDFFVLMGDDDKLEPGYLEEFIKLIEKYPHLDVYHCRSKIIDEDSNILSLTPSCPEYETVYENIWHRMQAFRVQFISDFVYRTQTLKSNGGFYKLPLAWASDDISAYIAMGRKGIAHTQDPIFCYRQNSQTISKTGNAELKLQAIEGETKWLNDFLKENHLNGSDQIFHRNIKNGLRKYSQKKKIHTIAQHIRPYNWGSVYTWFNHRNKYHYSITELAYSIILNIKQTKVKRNFNTSR